MFISRFNRYFERHGRWTYFLLGLIISLSFVLFLTPGRILGRRSMFGRTVGSMYGKTLKRDDFLRRIQETDVAIFLQRGRLLSDDSSRSDELVRETLKRMRALREAKRRGLTAVSNEELADAVQALWIFQADGKFDRKRFSQFEKNFLPRRSLDGSDLDRIIRENIAIRRLEDQVTANVFVSPTEVRDFYNQIYEEYKIKYALFKADVKADGDPGEAEVHAYFDKHRQELRGPERKRVRVAIFTSRDRMDKVKVSDKEIKDHFEKLLQSAYKGKKLAEVKKQIAMTLKRGKAIALAREQAQAVVKALGGGPAKGESPEQFAERFAKACKEAGVTPKETGPFLDEGVVPGIGQFPVFRRQAYGLTAEKPFSGLIYDAGRYFLACWLETIPGKAPEKLDKTTKKQIREAILAAEAKKLYAEKVEPYRKELEKAENAWDLTKYYDEKLALQPDLTEEKKAELRDAFRDDIRLFIAPNFIPRQKKILAVVFRPATFREKVKVTDGDIADYYREHQADYNKKEVRARQILLRVPPKATEAQKKEIAAKLNAILDDLHQGASFEKLARAHSEDFATRSKGGDMGFLAKGTKPPAVDKALFSMEPGEISPVLETPSAYVVVKVEEKRDGRTLEQVKDEIRIALLKERSEALARDAAADFTDEAFDAIDALQNGDETAADSSKAPDFPARLAAAFKKTAQKAGLRVQESEFFRERGVIPPFGYDRDLVSEAFKLTPENPLSDPIKGRDAFYVACWVATKAPEIPRIEGDQALLRRLVGTARRVRAIKAARARAQAEYERIRKELAAKKTFGEAAGKTEFKETDAFTRYRPPAGVPSARKIVEQVRKVPPQTLLKPIRTSDGAVLTYLLSRTLPAEEKFASEKGRFEMQLQWMKRRAVLDRFYQRLERESDTRLTKAWQPKKAKA